MRFGLSEVAMLTLLCAGLIILARAALTTAVAMPCLTSAVRVCAQSF